jgi:4-hydroxy-tetrahydrodipicolinate reductase
MSIKIAIHGAAGRMGRSLVRVVHETEGAELVGAVDHGDAVGKDAGALAGVDSLGVSITSDARAAVSGADVVIDFTLPDATAALLPVVEAANARLVIGTTGLAAETEAAIGALSKERAVVYAPNYSQGVTALFYLAERAAELMGPAFDAEIFEMHHRLKVDAPSGTAVKLLDVVARAKGVDPKRDRVCGREGQVGARTDAEIGVMTLRGGDVVGEHTLYLSGIGERLELTHRATDRMIFARGAVRAALFCAPRGPGLYDMFDVMGISRVETRPSSC